ncbi:MAG: hypothetical protein IT428_29115 [Planctomycetaceae bacterium]|nr:hypothetical protein [Planctomycetaceae bacterium]
MATNLISLHKHDREFAHIVELIDAELALVSKQTIEVSREAVLTFDDPEFLVDLSRRLFQHENTLKEIRAEVIRRFGPQSKSEAAPQADLPSVPASESAS